MKLKRLSLLILFLPLLGLASLRAQETQPPTPPPTDSLTRYCLESGKSYPAETVAQLLDAAIEEGRAVVKNEVAKAYDEGYKAGAIDYAPNLAYWEAMAQAWKVEAKPGPTWGTVAVGTGTGFLTGFAAGVAAAILIWTSLR